MKKKPMMAFILITAAIAFAKPQTLCPVMGGKIDKAQYADVEGYRIYVCCEGCIETIKADLAKTIEPMKAKSIELEKTPADSTSGVSRKGWKRKSQ